MIGAFDNTFLTLMLKPSSRPTPNPATGKPVPNHRHRIDALLDEFSAKRGKIIIPTPSLSEALTFTDRPQEYFDLLESYACIEVVPFDQRAALELSLITRQAIGAGNKKSGVDADWQQVKLDRQIVAIAKVSNATVLYTDDSNQAAFARLAGLDVCHTWDLPLTGKHAQSDLLDLLKE